MTNNSRHYYLIGLLVSIPILVGSIAIFFEEFLNSNWAFAFAQYDVNNRISKWSLSHMLGAELLKRVPPRNQWNDTVTRITIVDLSSSKMNETLQNLELDRPILFTNGSQLTLNSIELIFGNLSQNMFVPCDKSANDALYSGQVHTENLACLNYTLSEIMEIFKHAKQKNDSVSYLFQYFLNAKLSFSLQNLIGNMTDASVWSNVVSPFWMGSSSGYNLLSVLMYSRRNSSYFHSHISVHTHTCPFFSIELCACLCVGMNR